MYHLGKVIEIFNPNQNEKIISSDETVQATVEMWDDNIITFDVAGKIEKEIKIGDLIVVDYTLVSEEEQGVPTPMNMITKILQHPLGQEAWTKYRDFHRNRMQAVTQGQPQMYR